MKTNAALITNILITTTLLSGTILASTLVSADNDSVVDEINITVPVSCTLSGTGMNTHNANINNGQYNSAIGETTLKAFCNDNEGFAIYAIGFTDNEDGKNVLTNSTLGSTHDIVTGTATGPVNNVDTSQWAMKLFTITSPTPTYPIVIAGSTDDADKEQGDPDYSTFQEVPDDYTLVAKRTSGTDTGTSAEGATLKSTYQAYISKTQPAGTYTGQVKYTLVHPANAPTPHKPVVMQNVNEWKTSVAIGEEITAIDSRDGKSYTIARLADGNLWMTQNLDHDIVTDGSVIYDNTTTDLGWNTSTNSYDVARWVPSTATTTTTFIESYNTPESFNPGDLYWNGTTSSDYTNNQISSTGESNYHLGNYYNWLAAVALNDVQGIGDHYDAGQSICPVGWTLPSESAFQNLVEQYGWSSGQMTNPTIWNTPIRLPLSGSNGTSVGSVGKFWGPVMIDYYDFGITSGLIISYDGNVESDSNNNPYTRGNSIRCISR